MSLRSINLAANEGDAVPLAYKWSHVGKYLLTNEFVYLPASVERT